LHSRNIFTAAFQQGEIKMATNQASKLPLDTITPAKDGISIDVQHLASKLLKHQGSRVAPSMGVIPSAGGSGR
jgi:hypothetical protein